MLLRRVVKWLDKEHNKVSKTKDTNEKDVIKAKEKVARSVTSKAELKNVEIVSEILEQQTDVRTHNSLPSTYTKIKSGRARGLPGRVRPEHPIDLLSSLEMSDTQSL